MDRIFTLILFLICSTLVLTQSGAEERPVEATPDLKTFKECSVCPEMVVIPAGSFKMGSPKSESHHDSDEEPIRAVSISRFALGRTEITFTQWDACVADGGCSGYRPDDEGWGRGSRPVINVSWDYVQTYLAWLNEKIGAKLYRLPSEAEWEYAVRAGTVSAYYWGDDFSKACTYENSADAAANSSMMRKWPEWMKRIKMETACENDQHIQTAPVGSFRANPFNLYDMGGNVREWLQDCWNNNYRNAPSTGTAWMSGSCSAAVARGGAWNLPPYIMRSAERGEYYHEQSNELLGFRVARTLASR